MSVYREADDTLWKLKTQEVKGETKNRDLGNSPESSCLETPQCTDI